MLPEITDTMHLLMSSFFPWLGAAVYSGGSNGHARALKEDIENLQQSMYQRLDQQVRSAVPFWEVLM